MTSLAVSLLVGGAVVWQRWQTRSALPGIASGNGRLEATEVDVATKLPGRIEAVLANEGDLVQEGQIVARMDAAVLRAQLREAEAEQRRLVEECKVAAARITQRESELVLAKINVTRSRKLAGEKALEQAQLDRDEMVDQTASAALIAAKAEAVSADAAVDSALAKIESINADLKEMTLKSPRMGRVQYRLAEAGEVLPNGGRVLTLIDVTDVYMTFFLPTAEAGKLVFGSEARIVLDALPGRAIPATVSFVSPTAQFTPKEVETRTEREKLMFRVKVKIDPALLLEYVDYVKTGLPGVAYVKVDSNALWPASLQSDLTASHPGAAR